MDILNLMTRAYSIREIAALLAEQASNLERDLSVASADCAASNNSISPASAHARRASCFMSEAVKLLDDAYTDLNIHAAVSALPETADDDAYEAAIAAAAKVLPRAERAMRALS